MISTIYYSEDNTTYKTQEHKFENACGYEEVQSPSTDYTDVSEICESHDLVMRKEEFSSDCFLSSKFISEISALEPLVDAMPQFLLDQSENDYKLYNKELTITWDNTPATKPASRKVSYETSPVTEEEEENTELKGWTEKKDKVLKNLASKCKYDWKKIAKKFNTSEESEYTPLELKQKYKDLNKVSIPLRVKFAHEEDLMIAKYFDIYGCDWVQIATFFADRTAIMLKNRYYSHIRKRNLLNTMLDEVKCTEDPTAENTVEESEIAQTEVEQAFFRAFSMDQFNSLHFELENTLVSELHDRITVSHM